VPVACGETPDPAYQSVIVRIHGEQSEALPSTRPAPSDDESLPVVLSPRNTHLADGRPEIRWRAVEGAEEYEVVVSGPGGELWRTVAQETELPYPEAQPPLEAEVGYLIQVTARGAQSEQPRLSEAVLVTVLSAARMEQVRQFEAQIEGLGLSVESASFFLAAYYADQELYRKAIVELVSLVEETPSPPAHRLLGDVYLDVGLDDEAAQSYRNARELAQEQGNRRVQAEAEVGLGHVEFAAGRFEEALSHYRAAQVLYQELGLASDAEAVAKLASDTEARFLTPTP
jgi:tetratricopeptide (TPR) repeat protein